MSKKIIKRLRKVISELDYILAEVEKEYEKRIEDIYPDDYIDYDDSYDME